MKNSIYNIYCDESCHLENDNKPVMLLGALWAPNSQIERLNQELKHLKEQCKARGEIKWTKVSNSRLDFWKKVVEWFFSNDDLHFRGFIVSNKQSLNHSVFNQNSHDDFYYKMYFSLLNKILSPENSYNIYLDIKDTRSRFKLQKLKDILSNDKYDFTGQMINKMQHVHSENTPLLQVTDFLLGAINSKFTGHTTSEAKLSIVKLIEHFLKQKRILTDLTTSTPLRENKFNLFVWTPRPAQNA
ncbi:MAG: DUF3800 domain-containing protein [Chlamydiia bacterium]|nr:DUF3800 domain-containing protein [Chlamydiia bacterium]